MTRVPAPDIPLEADERTMLIAFLDFYRAALVDRAHDLTSDQLQIALPPSTLTLSRLVGHMALVERIWFRDRFEGIGVGEPYESLDWDVDGDAEMTLAQSWSADELMGAFDAAVADSRARVDAATSLDSLSALANRAGAHWSLRWILVHMIEEYARHCGHADLIRESIDGDVAG